MFKLQPLIKEKKRKTKKMVKKLYKNEMIKK